MLTKTGAPSDSPSTRASGSAPGAEIALRGLGHSFGELRALDGFELSAGAGEVVGIVGPSGCGKSTLLEIVAGLREQSEGTVAIGVPRAAEDRLPACALMPQRDLLLPWLSAIDNAGLAPRLAGATRGSARELATPLFERLGLAGFEAARPEQLSGGMRQRVAFLRTLMADKPVLLLDEPFASLDAITRAEMQTWLAEVLRGDAHTVLLVTHDVEEALYLADRVAVMTPRPGRVATLLDSPDPRATDRPGAVTSPEFVHARQLLLETLAGSPR